jgi:cytochrome b561
MDAGSPTGTGASTRQAPPWQRAMLTHRFLGSTLQSAWAARKDISAMRYTRTARTLHWITVALLLAIAPLGLWLGWAMPEDEALKLRLYMWHESLGFLVLPVTLFRLLWRWRHPPPPGPPQPAALAGLAHANHLALYALLLAQPVVGILTTAAWGFPPSLFGLLPLPVPMGENQALAPLLTSLHGWIALSLGLLVLLHASAALLWHGLVRRDGLLRRMV